MTSTVIGKMRRSRQLLQTNDKLLSPLFAPLLSAYSFQRQQAVLGG
jgi:hypothetical protein